MTITSPTTATGVWYLEDTVIPRDHNMMIHGTGIYCDEYVKQGEDWLIARTGYERIWLWRETLLENDTRHFRTMFDDKEVARSKQRDKRDFEWQIFG